MSNRPIALKVLTTTKLNVQPARRLARLTLSAHLLSWLFSFLIFLWEILNTFAQFRGKVEKFQERKWLHCIIYIELGLHGNDKDIKA